MLGLLTESRGAKLMSHFSRMLALRLAWCVLLLGAVSATWAQDGPTQPWFYCYAPSSWAKDARPPTIYMSGVSKATRITANTAAAASAAFHAYVLEKYGADLGARCEWRRSEAAAQGGIAWLERGIALQNSDAKGNGGANAKVTNVVTTGWVWTQPASDTVPSPTAAPKPPPTPEPGAITH
jgi:hypothetical protein